MQENIALPECINSYGHKQKRQARVICFPFAGAGAVAFQPWAKHFKDTNIDFLGVSIPGRENLIKEKFETSIERLCEKLLPNIVEISDKPYVFLGHSLGGLIAFELCRLLRRDGHSLPIHLFVSAVRSPNMLNPNTLMHTLSDQQLIKEIGEYGGTPNEILSNPRLLSMILPTLKADFKLFESYEYKEGSPMNIPITALSGIADRIARPEYMHNWKYQTNSEFDQIEYPGNHFFLQNNQHKIIPLLTQALSNI